MASRTFWCWLALVSSGTPAAAEPGFAWQAPSGCPSADELRLRVEHRLGRAVEGMLHGIEIAVARDRGGYVATVDLRGVTVSNDIRTLRSARCDELADAIAVIVARVASEPRQTPAAYVVDDEVPPGDEDQELRRPQPERAVVHVAREWGGGVRVLALSGVGAQPGLSVGGELAGYVRHHQMFAEVSHARWPKSSELLQVGAPGGVDVSLNITALRVGWGPEAMPLRAWVGAELGTMNGAGIELDDSGMGSGRWTAIDAGFGVAWPMAKHARLVGTFEVATPLGRTRFALVDGVQIYQSGLGTARCALGIEVGWR